MGILLTVVYSLLVFILKCGHLILVTYSLKQAVLVNFVKLCGLFISKKIIFTDGFLQRVLSSDYKKELSKNFFVFLRVDLQ